uniref:Uncharacterized protein n=1 Tax=Corvus moneduloides TaxID=1196302 RepID=A0A8C3D5A1_CORMO
MSNLGYDDTTELMDLLQRSILYSIRTVDTGSEVRLQYTSGTACFFLLY